MSPLAPVNPRTVSSIHHLVSRVAHFVANIRTSVGSFRFTVSITELAVVVLIALRQYVQPQPSKKVLERI